MRIKPGFVAVVCLTAWMNGRFCLYFFLALLVHELGHVAAMLLLRVPIRGLCLQASGAVIHGEFPGYGKELLCAAAGPLTGLVAAAAVLRQLPELAIVSVALSAVNLLPVYPMDGGRILRCLLLLKMEPTAVQRILSIVSGGICCLMMFAACWAVAELQSGLWPLFGVLVLLWRVGTANIAEH